MLVPPPLVGTLHAAFKIPGEIDLGANDDAKERLLSNRRVVSAHGGSALLGRRRWALKLVRLMVGRLMRAQINGPGCPLSNALRQFT